MKIYNKTNQIQELKVYDRESSREFSIYVCAHSFTELERNLHAPSLPRLKNIFQVVDETLIMATEEVTEIIPKEEPKEEIHLDVVVPESLSAEEAPVEEPSTLICDICGEEFASARSLSRHKNKAHSEESL